MAGKQTGEDDACTRRHQLAQRHRQPRERSEQDIGEDQIIRCRACDDGRAGPGGACKRNQRRGAVEPRIGLRRAHGNRVDIAGDNCGAQQARRCDRQDAAAGPDIENAPVPPPPGQIGEREQAAIGRPVMAGAKSERGLDLDSDIVGLGRARSCAPWMTKRPARTGLRPARLWATQSAPATRSRVSAFAAASPAAIPTNSRKPASSGARKVDRKLPAPVIAFKCGTGSVVEGFTEIAGEPPGRGFVAGRSGQRLCS